MKKVNKWAVETIEIYQKFISPYLGKNCRFFPSCSDYAKEAIKQKGVFLGVIFSFKRLSKCHPLCAGGVDPVV